MIGVSLEARKLAESAVLCGLDRSEAQRTGGVKHRIKFSDEDITEDVERSARSGHVDSGEAEQAETLHVQGVLCKQQSNTNTHKQREANSSVSVTPLRSFCAVF